MKNTKAIFCFAILLGSLSCSEKEENVTNEEVQTIPSIHLLTDVKPTFDDGDVNAVIEIPSGSIEKWEINKSTGIIEREYVDGKPRTIKYVGYPGNYGFIPQTLLSKENGGDGDPLDIIILGPPTKRSNVVKSKLIGILYLKDRGEQDDKLIAVSSDSPLYHINSIEEIEAAYAGVIDIVKLWFANYKGPGKMEVLGIGDRNSANQILNLSIEEYTHQKKVINTSK
jgi:inorganic pyrophosphatase